MEGGKFAQGVGSVFLKLKEPLRYRWWDGSGRTAPHGLVEFCRIGNHPLLRLPDKTFIGIDFVISGQKAEIVS
ncbi:MAG: hypothetical protein KGJ34_00780 [Patescibacteria group bacterium]|nr:hypothetical protein [Patescibacteria group bacterium]